MGDFRRYLAARVLSVAGSLVSVVALPVLVYQLTGSASWTSAVAAAEAVPYLVFGLVAGAVADRVDRRALMVRLDLVAALLLVSVPVAWAVEALSATHVLLVGFGVQTVFVFFDAANFGALPTLVGKERLTTAYSTLYGSTTVTELVVPPLVGLVVAVVAPAPLIALNALTAVGSALLIRAITRPLSIGHGTPQVRRDIRSGLDFLWRNRIVRVLTLVGTTHSAASGAWVAMLVPWADQTLGIRTSGDARLAVLFGCWGAGGVAAAKLVPRLSERLGAARLALAALPTSLLCGCLVALSTHWMLALFSAAAWGAAHSTVVLNAITYRQQVIPDELQSRVNTTCRMLAWGLGQPLGAALAGAMSAFGPRAGLAAGVGVLASGVLAAWITPTLRAEATRPSRTRTAVAR
ncbi:Predicted arabinose efflux permease, MFS family [Streptoalloteichus hindustanus]|uniref:Predicted arabinose efflux permease, MFS family n=2 Tax=Streptoalloteichus hindustanus TaxID=2017 RepID=A0A1M5CV15_STRHI|nr:Predicted arabinose efflux permease, MFS family [Streptoalloteichus hindustanus]